MRSIFCVLLACLVYNVVVAYNDKDLKCPTREHISGFVRVISGKIRNVGHRCSKFFPALSEDTTCTLGKPLECNGEAEGCEDDAWIGGFQVFDSGVKAEVYVPYCCTSSQVAIRKDKCRVVEITHATGRPIHYYLPASKVIYRLNCQYVKNNNGSALQDMSFSSKECQYFVDKKNKD